MNTLKTSIESPRGNNTRYLLATVFSTLAACNTNVDRPVTAAQGTLDFALLQRAPAGAYNGNTGVLGQVTPTQTGVNVSSERRSMSWNGEADDIIIALERGPMLSTSLLCNRIAGVRCEMNTDGSLNEICFATNTNQHDSIRVTTTDTAGRTNVAYGIAACRVSTHSSWIDCQNDARGQTWICAH